MNSNEKRILVTLDGSNHALDTVRYLSRILPPHGTELVLFCVLNRKPEYFLDSAEDAPRRLSLNITNSWQIQQKKAIEEFMEIAHQLITERGVPSQAVKIKIQERKEGIARDIIREARNGYDLVVAGRQGMNPITRLVIGSIAGKLIQTLTFVPLLLVGNTTPSNKILIAVDASEASLRAVEHTGNMLGGTNLDLTLFRVIRNLREDEMFLHAAQDGSRLQAAEESISRETFEKASQLLLGAGIHQAQITTKVVSGVATRSGAIIAQATSGGYETIVMGRRGHSEVGEFSMGRVTNKVIQLAGKLAVWVVN